MLYFYYKHNCWRVAIWLAFVWAISGVWVALWAQPHRLVIVASAADSATLAPLALDYADSAACRVALQRHTEQLRRAGYVGVSIDSLWRDAHQTRAVWFVGQLYQLENLRITGIDQSIEQRSGINRLNTGNRAWQIADIERLNRQLLRYAENNGYPFAQTQLQNIRLTEQGAFSADLNCQLNSRMLLDTITIEGGARISRRYLWRYLHLPPNAPYRESDVEQVSARLRELPFLQEMHPPLVQFNLDGKARLKLFVKPRKASRFDFLLGILPTTVGGVRRYQLTGEGLLNLYNALGAGELLDLQFKNYPNNIKELKARVSYPYLPLLPLGGDIKFELYLRDTLFRNIQGYIAAQYLMRGNNHWKAYVQLQSSDILSVDSAAIALSKRLPAVLDTRSTLYGIEFSWSRLDYRFNARRGFACWLNIGIGNKTFRPNPQIVDIGASIETDLAAQYDSLNRVGLHGQLSASLEKFTQLGRNSTIYTALRTAWKPPQITMLNEAYRIGGSRLLRGFDEESILATFYGIFTVEYRYLLGLNAYAMLFGELAYVENRSRNATSMPDRPLSFGVGMTFETKAGVFGLTYALGRQQGNSIDFRAGKIHLAYINYF